MAERLEFTLSKGQITELENMKEDIEYLNAQLQKAERAGFDTSELREKYEKLRRLREGILREYSPK